jgi:peptidoglycan/LPS O-acetylase OafA/YrhL
MALQPDLVLVPYMPWHTIRFCAIFLCGSLFYLKADHVRFDNSTIALGSFVGLSVVLFSNRLAEIGVATFGGYLIFWLAFVIRSGAISRIVQKMDISYGVYLYAWPIQKLILWNWPAMKALTLSLYALPLSMAAGLLSWMLIERPAMAARLFLTVRNHTVDGREA